MPSCIVQMCCENGASETNNSMTPSVQKIRENKANDVVSSSSPAALKTRKIADVSPFMSTLDNSHTCACSPPDSLKW